MGILKNNHMVIGVCSSIAAYKVLDLVGKLRKEGAKVNVIMTDNAIKLVDSKEFKRVSGNDVAVGLFHPKVDYKWYLENNKKMKHISLADTADMFLIVPATANIIGKVANGIADDLLSTSIMATKARVVFAPAMNVKMWENKFVRENVLKLKKNGYEFINPEKGVLACGYEGVGRLANLDKIIDDVSKILGRQEDLKGKKILVTAGATVEEIDPVRVITNKSSGKMGVAIAEQAYLRGADVLLLRGKNSVKSEVSVKEEEFDNIKNLHDLVKKNVKKYNVMIHSAAVSDFSALKKEKKIKSHETLHLELTPTAKILENVKKLNREIFLIGFKAEYKVSKKELVEAAMFAIRKSKADLIVANDVGKQGRGFDVDTNEVFIIDTKKRVKHACLMSKKDIANKILDEIK